MSFKGMLAAALIVSAAAYASNDVDMPAEQGLIQVSSDQPAVQEAFYTGQSDVVATAPAGYVEGMEVPFVERMGSPRPILGYAWCLVEKPATFTTVTTECQIRPEATYTKCIPAEYAVQEVQVMVAPEKKVAYCLPAKFICKKVKVMVEEPQTCYSIIPAEYKWVEEEVDVQLPGSNKIWIDPVYKTVEEKIMVKPPMRKMGEGACPKPADGDISICVTSDCSPAEYVTIQKEVLVKEGELRDVACAGRKMTIKKKVMTKPAEVKECVIPAKYEEIDVAEIAESGSVEFKTVPAQYKCVKRLVMVRPESSAIVKVPAKTTTQEVKVVDQPATMVWRLMKKDGCEITE